jgi:hypothetical protein
MAPYPDPAGRPRPPSANGLVWLFALAGIGAFLTFGTLIAWGAYRLATRKPQSPLAAAPSSAPSDRAKLPPVQRRVPHHPLSILDGCSQGDLGLIDRGIDDAISVGAPLYNSGNFAGCYHMYEGAAADVERKLSDACPGPKGALEDGRTRAASLSGPSAQAWAMRDAFDALVDVIGRRQAGNE